MPMIKLPEPLKRLFMSMKVWTVILWMVLTPFTAYFAKVGWELSDTTVQKIAEFMTLIFGILLGVQGATDLGKEKEKEKAKAEAAKLQAQHAHELVMAAAGLPVAANAVTTTTTTAVTAAPPAQAGFIATKLMALIAVLGLAAAPMLTSCGNPGPGPVIGQVTIDCLSSSRSSIDALLGEFKALLTGGKIDWASVYQRAKTAGREIGGCALAEFVQLYLGGNRSIEEGDGWNAHMALEEFRASEANGASFKARCSREDGSTAECKL